MQPQRQHSGGVVVGRRAKPRLRVGRGEGARAHEPVLVFLWTDRAGRPEHQHVAVFDDHGWGITSETQGHTHEVRGLEVMPAADGHRHELTIERAQAAPVVYYRYRMMLMVDREKEE